MNHILEGIYVRHRKKQTAVSMLLTCVANEKRKQAQKTALLPHADVQLLCCLLNDRIKHFGLPETNEKDFFQVGHFAEGHNVVVDDRLAGDRKERFWCRER